MGLGQDLMFRAGLPTEPVDYSSFKRELWNEKYMINTFVQIRRMYNTKSELFSNLWTMSDYDVSR